VGEVHRDDTGVQRLFIAGPRTPGNHGGVEGERRIGRAAFLAVTATGLSSLVWGRAAWEAVTGVVPSGVGGVLPAPTGGWRIYTVAATMPDPDPATFRLRIVGRVRRPVSLSLDDLRSLPRAEQVSDFHCVTGWSVDHVRWGGVRLGEVLAAAGPLPDARALSFVSAERPYVDSLTMRQALLGDVMLAWEQDGRPLSRAHGAPLRLVMPRMYGYKNVKWVERIELTPAPVVGYWEERGYDRDAWVGRSNDL